MKRSLSDRELRGWIRGDLGGLLGQPQRQLAICADGFVLALVRLHDFLHQAVAHHVAVIELDELDTFHAAKNVGHFD
jgi:hypothetical protein